MTARILTTEETQALRDTAQTGPLVAQRCCAYQTHAGRWSVRRADGTLVAEVAGLSGNRAEAVARLLAAAPDLAATVVSLHERVDALVQRAETAEQAGAKAAQERDEARDREVDLGLAVWREVHGEVCGMPPLDTPRDRAEVLAAVRALREERDELRADLESERGFAEGRRQQRNEALARAEKLTRVVTALRGDVGHAETVAGASMGHVDDMADELAAVTAERDALRTTAEHEANDVVALRAIIEGRTTPPTDAEAAAHHAAGGAWLVAWRRSNLPTVASIVSGPRVWWPKADVVGAVALDAERRPCAWPVATEAPDAAR